MVVTCSLSCTTNNGASSYNPEEDDIVSFLVVDGMLFGFCTCSGDCCKARCGAFFEVCWGYRRAREAAKFVMEAIRSSDNLFYFYIVRDSLAYQLR